MNISDTISEALEVYRSKIGKDSVTVFAGNVLGAALGFAATVMITRTLGPAQFGLFSLALAVMGVAAQFSDFGFGTGMVRFASMYLRTDAAKADLMFKVSLKVRLLLASVVFLAGFFASGALASVVFENPELALPLKLAFSGAFGTSLAGYVLTVLQAKREFGRFTLINLINPVVKLAAVGLLFLALKLDLFSALTTVIVIPFLALVIGSLIIPKGFLKAKGNERERLGELFHFSKWIMVSVLCVMIFNRLDVLMLSYFKASEEVGYYSAAYSLAAGFTLITMAITAVLLPEVSRLSKTEDLRRYTGRSIKYTLPILAPVAVLLAVANPAILLIYGSEYGTSATVFRVLICGLALSVIANPIGLVLYALNRPQVAAYLNILQLVGNFTANFFLIPPFGAVGAAGATLFVRVLGVSFTGVYIFIALWKQRPEGTASGLP